MLTRPLAPHTQAEGIMNTMKCKRATVYTTFRIPLLSLEPLERRWRTYFPFVTNFVGSGIFHWKMSSYLLENLVKYVFSDFPLGHQMWIRRKLSCFSCIISSDGFVRGHNQDSDEFTGSPYCGNGYGWLRSGIGLAPGLKGCKYVSKRLSLLGSLSYVTISHSPPVLATTGLVLFVD